MGDDVVRQMRGMLQSAQALSRSDNPFAKVSGERIAVILVDALFELDLAMDNPWDAMPAIAEAPGKMPETGSE